MVDLGEGLRLDWVELCQAIDIRVELLYFFKLQVFHEARVEILQLGRSCELLWQEQVLEANRQRGFGMKPSVG